MAEHRSLSIDLETRSEVDLADCGVYRYVEGEDWKILLFCYAFDDDEEIRAVDMGQGEELPPDVLEALEDPGIIKYAWNAAFERTNLSKYLGRRLDPSQWRCTMVWAAELSLPLSLDKAAEALNASQQKDKRGKDLIALFSVMQKDRKTKKLYWVNPEDRPEEYAEFKSYCRQDVRTEVSIRKRLEKYPVPDSEWELYAIDQTINDLGVMIDTDLAQSAQKCGELMSEKLAERARELTGLENPNSVVQLKKWLEDNGVFLEKLGKKEVGDLLADPSGGLPDTVRDMLGLRLQLSKASIKKYEAAMRCTCSDGRARGLFQFYGANRTGRFAGRHIQLQNLRRNDMPALDLARDLIKARDTDMLETVYGDAMDALSQCCRTMLVPKPGCEFIVADFSAIEARVIAWLSGEEWTLEAFRNGQDLYCTTASQMFGVPVEKHGVNGELRQKGKVAVLACIAEGELVLTDRGLIPIQDVTKEMKVWDGEEWVSHEGAVCRGEKKVISYEGLTATADHPVWTEEEDEPVPFGHAASNGLHLMMTGAGTSPIKFGMKNEDRIFTPWFKPDTMPVYDIVNAGPRHRFTVSGVLVHNCGYGGGAGALKAMGALDMGLTENELPDLVTAYRDANPHIVRFWKNLDNAAVAGIRDHRRHVVGEGDPDIPHRVRFEFSGNTLWMVLPSGRSLAYVAPKVGKNRFGGRSIVFKGLGLNNKWSDIETYGAKISENCVAAGTGVLTNKGLVSIENIEADDLIWDGEEYVSHGGAVCKGRQSVVQVKAGVYDDGVWLTGDHPILTAKGWVECGKADGMIWKNPFVPVSAPRLSGRHFGEEPIRVCTSRRRMVNVYDILDCGPRHQFCIYDPGADRYRIVHNCTQAVARDVLCNSMRNLRKEGVDIVAHVHDECICEVPKGRFTVDDICRIMARNPEWCPDLPLVAAGYLAPNYYFKD